MLKGTIVFRLTNVGTKSEGKFPFLECEGGELIRVWKAGDISFEGSDFMPYDGMSVILSGEYNENGIFVADSVSTNIPDAEPAQCDVEETDSEKSDS